MLRGNKGEWSEVYTLFKILSDKKLFAGDKDLQKIDELFFPIIRVLREELVGTYEYSYESDLVVIKGLEEVFKIPINKFHEKALLLLQEIKESTTSAFEIQEIEEFMSTFQCFSIKAQSSQKSDIRIVLHDYRTGTDPELGFSIKSQLGGASTLLNASTATNFVYKINNLTLSDDEITEINSINSRSKIKDRIKTIHERNGSLEFLHTESSIFGNNLTLIDSALPAILSDLTMLYFTSTLSNTSELVDRINERNPIKYDLATDHPFYSYKIKRFLTDVALGMMPSLVWTGNLDATGGYLIVKDSGEILCYHIYNRNAFEDYLIVNTKFETASSTKHNFGSVYRDSDILKFKLNLQIRFLK